MAFAALIFPALAGAFNLGTLQKSEFQNVRAGETAIFLILFWNSEGEEYAVELSGAGLPEGWTIIAAPSRFLLNSTPSGKTERIYLPGPKNTISAKVVEVYVVVPDTAPRGQYEAVLQATAGNSGGAGFSLLQERRFSFTVNVSEGFFSNHGGAKTSEANRAVIVNITPDTANEKMTEEIQSDGFLSTSFGQSSRSGNTTQKLAAAAVIAIIIAAWMVYRHD